MKKLCYSFILLVSFLSATIINVPEDYSTIQAGIDASVNGDTVLIAQGIYFENLILQKEIVLASHAINDDLDSDWLNNENINETIISGVPEPDDPSKGSCLVIRGSSWDYSGNPQPEIIGLTFQDGVGTSMSVNDCDILRSERSGGAILIFEAYPTIVYNRFLNNGGGENTGGGVVAAVTNGGAISHYDTDDVEFDEDRNSSSQDNNSSRTYVHGNPAAMDAYNNEKKFQKIQGNGRLSDVSSSKELVSSFKELEEMLAAARFSGFVSGVRDDDDFVPRVRSDLIIYMYDSYGDGWNGNVLTIGEHTFTLQSGEYGEETLSLDDGSYAVTCDGGSWQSEVSWQIVDAADGTEILAGGAPYEGGFELGGDPPQDVPDTLLIQNNYFEGNNSGDGENVYSHGYEGDIDVSGSVFEDIDCETNTVNEFVLSSMENVADYVQNDISGVCIESNTFYVSDDGDDSNDGTEETPLKTIGHALTLVRDAETPTTINLYPGVYSPSTNGEKFPIVLPDNVHLIGDESENTILDAEADAGNEAAVMIIKEVENVRVANLTLTGGYAEGHGCTGGGGILVTADDMYNLNGEKEPNNTVLENLIIENNHSHNGGGVSFFRVEGPSISNAIIRNNTASFHGGGIFSYISNTTVTDVEMHDNECLGIYWGGFNDVGHGGGFFLADGEGTFTGLNIHDNEAAMHGGGMGSAGSANWTLTNSTISNNVGPWLGGGLWLWDANYGENPTITNVTIEDNWASISGGGFLSNYSNPVFENCTIQNNEATGAGGGLCFWGGCSPVITDCVISGNSGTGNGGGVHTEGDAITMTRTFVVDNQGGNYIGGINVSGSDATFNNITISGNTSSGGGAIGIINSGHVDLTNSIVWDNYGDPFLGDGTGSLSTTYSDIEDGWGGEGNIDADPLFTDADNGDYTLQAPDSPCIDAGTADTDGDGTDDITDYNGSAPDMGAFETTLAAPTGFTLYSLETYVTLLWDAVSNDDFNYYMVERSTDVEFADDFVSNALLVNYFEDHDLEYDTEYFYRVYYVAAGANSDYSDVLSVTLEWLDVDGEQLPTVYALHQNYPNPFNPLTSLSYDLPEDAMVNITVFDMMGRVVRTLANGQQSAGYKSLQWNGTNNSGHPISAGLYIYTIQAGEFSQTRKMILLK